MIKLKISILPLLLLFLACQNEGSKVSSNPQTSSSQWEIKDSISIDGIKPIGLVTEGANFWISDGDHNRLVLVDKTGKILKEETDIERPMHFTQSDGKLYVPSYGTDEILIIKDGNRTSYELKDSLDAPAGVAVLGDDIAIADFYNHRILLVKDGKEISIGSKGKELGQFHYPTDVQLTADKVYVADAYNNRIQVFDRLGKPLQTFGAAQKMNAATGLYVSEKEVFVTDFENDRVLIFDLNGKFKQVLEKGLNKPTDLLIYNQLLYVVNYGSEKITIFESN